MQPDNARWVEVTSSQFAHERAGLEAVRQALPDEEPYRAWSNLELITGNGRLYEVDLLILAPAGFFLIELKAWGGRLGGDRHRWAFRGERVRTQDSPLPLANTKAKVLRELLNEAVRKHQGGKKAKDVARTIPFIRAAILLHGPDLKSELPSEERAGIFALDGAGSGTGLPELVRGLITKTPDPTNVVTAAHAQALALLLDDVGIGRRKQRSIGSYRLLEQLGEGPGWQDSLAQHVRFPDELVRIRTWHTGRATSAEERGRLERAADREYRLLRRLDHPGLVAPTEYLDTEGGPALVYPYDAKAERLDLMLARRGAEITLTERLALIRGLAETLRYAHGRRITHRGLSPHCVLVRPDGPQITDWQTANRTAGSLGPATRATLAGTRHVSELLTAAQQGYAAPESIIQGEYDATYDDVRADVFGLGALAYLILTGSAPAADGTALKQRLRAERSLDPQGLLDAPNRSIRDLVRDATTAAVADRISSVEDFLELLSVVEAELADDDLSAETDPLDAEPGAPLGTRFSLVRRLGSGSTAIGLLVTDADAGGVQRVLKVARDEQRAARLHDELDTLLPMPSFPEIASLAELDLLMVGERTALLLESAGEQTLAQQLRAGGRLSLDYLERYGTDLLTAAARLSEYGVDHRDIKPDNLGVRERPGSRTKHLVLFDFSLSRAALTDVNAGTPPYLDPFLGPPLRPTWDAAAERYSVAITLYEMATGGVPVFGDGASDPALIQAEATVSETSFDPGIAAAMVRFFQKALRREASERHVTVGDMAAAWARIWASIEPPPTNPSVVRDLASVDRSTPLAASGLSARALSALEPLQLATVAELLAVPRFRISKLPNVADSSRREIQSAVGAWRESLQATATTSNKTVSTTDLLGGLAANGRVEAIVDALQPKKTPRNELEVSIARLLLGRPSNEDGRMATGHAVGSEPWPTPARLAKALGEKRGRVQQIVDDLRSRWAKTSIVSGLCDTLSELLTDLGGVATDVELAAALLAQGGLSDSSEPGLVLNARNLVALATETELDRGGAGAARWARRRLGEVVIIAAEPNDDTDADLNPDAGRIEAAQLLDLAAALGHEAATAVASGEPLTPTRASTMLRAVAEPSGAATLDATRLVSLAAATSGGAAAVSARGELYPVGLAPALAIRLSQATAAAGALRPGQAPENLSIDELRSRVRSRFPRLSPLPGRPALDRLLTEAGSVLTWDPTHDVYRAPPAPQTTMATQAPTGSPAIVGPGSTRDEVDVRLRDSIEIQSFLVLGSRARDLNALPAELSRAYGVTVLNVTDLLLNRMRSEAEAAGVAWDLVLAADAAEAGSGDGQGLRDLVGSVVDGVTETVTEAVGPVLLTELSPLARYGHLGRLASLADHTNRTGKAVWLLIAASERDGAPVIDGAPVPVVTPSQWLLLPPHWSPGMSADSPSRMHA